MYTYIYYVYMCNDIYIYTHYIYTYIHTHYVYYILESSVLGRASTLQSYRHVSESFIVIRCLNDCCPVPPSFFTLENVAVLFSP